MECVYQILFATLFVSSVTGGSRLRREEESCEVLTPCSQLCAGGTQLLRCDGSEDYVTGECNTHLCVPDCTLCDYGSSSVYFPDYFDCSKYYRCERIQLDDDGNFDYRRHHMQCSNRTYWAQDDLTCIREAGPHCLLVDSDGPTQPPPPPEGACDFRATYDPTQYYWMSAREVMPCPDGTVYDDDECSCVHGEGRPPECARSEGLLLYFPFDNDFNDVTCAKAHGEKHGDVTIQNEGMAGRSAHFGGSNGIILVHYMDNFFVGKDIDELTISVWFKRTGPVSLLEGLVNNGNCYETPSFDVHVGDGQVGAGSIHTTEPASTGNFQVKQAEWEHVSMVYDGQTLSYYLNGELQGDPTPITGPIQNRQCPMAIGQYGQDQTEGFFSGYIDELRIYTRTLAPTEVRMLFVNPAGGGATSYHVHSWQVVAMLTAVMFNAILN